ncbi:hypothetical protein I4F81_006072 [Pyropia yezoensis]|uniref:Uncharacterized protein n=1 Tax=Pyropia yezoensis TaxID=2788 RepID=A0ACC3C146_PYRYE|nr:hypothetical protein I4F81_006072 [Neopyropia yezoensis]
MDVFRRGLCAALRCDKDSSVVCLPANVVACLLSVIVLPVTDPESWSTGSRLSALAVCATAMGSGQRAGTTWSARQSASPLPSRRPSVGGKQQEQPQILSSSGLLTESAVEATCLLLLSGLQTGTSVRDYTNTGDILRLLSLAWRLGYWPAAATDSLAALAARDSSLVVDLALAATDDAARDVLLRSRPEKACTELLLRMSTATAACIDGGQERNAPSAGTRAVAIVFHPRMTRLLSVPGIIPFVPGFIATETPEYGPWCAGVTRYVTTLLRCVCVVLRTPSHVESGKGVGNWTTCMYTLAGTGLRLLITADVSLRKESHHLMCLLAHWFETGNETMMTIPAGATQTLGELRSRSPDALLRPCRIVATRTAADEADTTAVVEDGVAGRAPAAAGEAPVAGTVLRGHKPCPAPGPLFIFAIAVDAVLRMLRIAAARDEPSGDTLEVVASAAKLYWRAVCRRGRVSLPHTLSVSRAAMASTTHRLLQANCGGDLLGSGAVLLEGLAEVRSTLFYGKISRDLRRLSCTIDQLLRDLESQPRGPPGTCAGVPVPVNTRGTGTADCPIKIIDDDKELVALPSEPVTTPYSIADGSAVPPCPKGRPVRGDTGPVIVTRQTGAPRGSPGQQQLVDVGDLPQLTPRLAMRKAIGVRALGNATPTWKPVDTIVLRGEEDANAANNAATKWRRRVLRLVVAKAGMAASAVAADAWQRSLGSPPPRDLTPPVRAPTDGMRTRYGSSYVIPATHTDAAQALTVDVCVVVSGHPRPDCEDGSEDGDRHDRRIRPPEDAAAVSPGDLCNVWVDQAEADTSKRSLSTSVDAVCVRRSVVAEPVESGSGTTKATLLWLSVRRTDAPLLPCHTNSSDGTRRFVVVTLSLSIVSDWCEYSGLGE